MPDLYRVGNHNPRNIYRGGEHIGVVFSPADGPIVVAALNAADSGPPRCSDCGRGARQLLPWYGDVGNGTEVVAWLGPTCHRRRLDAARDAAYGGHTCVALTVPLGGER